MGALSSQRTAAEYRWRWARLLWTSAVSAALGGGCAAGVVPEPTFVEPRPGEFVFVSDPPPPPRVEQVPPQESNGSVWVRGYPHWSGRRWTFRQGAWERLRSGQRRTRWRWDVDGEGRYRYWPPKWTGEAEGPED